MDSGSVNTPRLSVIIPVYNDPEGIRDTIEALLRQSPPPVDYEIVVVDNGSTDNTPALVKQYAARYPGRVMLHVESSVRGSYAARNRGIEVSTGEHLVFLDSDVTVPEDYLKKVYEYLTTEEYEYLGCRVRVVPRVASLAAKYDAIHAFPTEVYFDEQRFVPTCCLSVRRSLVDRVGAFDMRFESGGDWEFAMRAERFGARKGFATDLCVTHPARTSLRALRAKRRRLGRGAAQRRHLDPLRFASRRSRVRDFLPSNPLRIKRDADARGVAVTLLETVVMSAFKFPLTWAFWSSFAKEMLRLREQSASTPGTV